MERTGRRLLSEWVNAIAFSLIFMPISKRDKIGFLGDEDKENVVLSLSVYCAVCCISEVRH